MSTWEPVTVDALEAIVEKQLSNCSTAQQALFTGCRQPFYPVPIHRLGQLEQVLVVAHLPHGLLYFEDVEDGFEVGELQQDGALHPHSCDQLELRHVLPREND
ncbi:hypothetical protein [Comamonas sp. JNW]|jgi:hypothetical protein|uniref:hypothetical protein n=1 Tax=unclassified Comamonas TaxID=2638500 RepID=UPI000DE76EE6|nr:hypothetical protein [Comamonas sp. JNW]PWB16595.1 hypothetical protein DCO45_17105 [Comamonas sp. JNW]